MCVILIGKITREQHKLALEQNQDGFSLFTRELGLVKAPTEKQVEEAIGKFGVWHYRIASSGKIDKKNIHPFEICRGRYLLYHNGVIGAGKGSKSDTAALAETLYDVNLTTARSVVKALANGNRFAIVSANDPRNFELFGEWTAEAGVLFSHKLYSYKLSKGGTTYYGRTIDNVFKR